MSDFCATKIEALGTNSQSNRIVFVIYGFSNRGHSMYQTTNCLLEIGGVVPLNRTVGCVRRGVQMGSKSRCASRSDAGPPFHDRPMFARENLMQRRGECQYLAGHERLHKRPTLLLPGHHSLSARVFRRESGRTQSDPWEVIKRELFGNEFLCLFPCSLASILTGLRSSFALKWDTIE
jgi:hypothetical protein